MVRQIKWDGRSKYLLLNHLSQLTISSHLIGVECGCSTISSRNKWKRDERWERDRDDGRWDEIIFTIYHQPNRYGNLPSHLSSSTILSHYLISQEKEQEEMVDGEKGYLRDEIRDGTCKFVWEREKFLPNIISSSTISPLTMSFHDLVLMKRRNKMIKLYKSKVR